MPQEPSTKLFIAREAADSVKPGVKRSVTPGTVTKLLIARAADSAFLCRILYRPLRGLYKFFALTVPGVPLSLHPRLYAIARYRGLG